MIRPPRLRSRRAYAWYLLGCILIGGLLYVFDLALLRRAFATSKVSPVPIRVADATSAANLSRFINFFPQFASNKLFVVVSSYLVNGDRTNRLGGSHKTEDLLLVVLGIGDFGFKAQAKHDEYKGVVPFIPSWFKCNLGNRTFDSNATLHKTGTAFEGSIGSHGNVRYFGERVVMISCFIPPQLANELVTAEGGVQSGQASRFQFQLVANSQTESQNHELDFGMVTPTWHLSQPNAKTVLCTTAMYGLTGSRWLTEWLFYHHYYQQFDLIEVYAMLQGNRNGPQALDTLNHLLTTHPNWLRGVNWSSVITPEFLHPKTGVGRGVPASGGFEHGQRLARTDCYLRNRNARFVGFLDIDELFFTPTGVDFQRDVVNGVCNETGVCQFKSVTAFPLLLGNVSHDLLFQSLDDRVESNCVPQFNCGEFHFGREKYLARGQANAGAFTVLAIHSISDSIPFAKQFPLRVVPPDRAFVRHFNPHPHKHTGGHLDGKRVPFPKAAIDRIQTEIQSDAVLHEIYSRAKNSEVETFLGLDKGRDRWRFKPPEL